MYHQQVTKCLICPRKFVIKARNPGKRFCCRKCASIFGAMQSKKGETDIEKILRDILESLKVPFESQQPVGNITIPDFIVAPNILLFADGEYWHNKPKAKKRDVKINLRLSKLNYVVLRFTGTELKEERSKVRRIIKKAVTTVV